MYDLHRKVAARSFPGISVHPSRRLTPIAHVLDAILRQLGLWRQYDLYKASLWNLEAVRLEFMDVQLASSAVLVLGVLETPIYRNQRSIWMYMTTLT